MNSSVLWLKIWSTTIVIQVQPDCQKGEMVEAHSLYLPGHVQQHVSSKHLINEDYIMVYILPTTSKAGS